MTMQQTFAGKRRGLSIAQNNRPWNGSQFFEPPHGRLVYRLFM